MKDWPQCTGCSAQLRLLKGSRCGTCLKKDKQIVAGMPPARTPLATQDPNISETDTATRSLQELQADARRNAMQARTLPKGGGARASTASSSLQVAVAKGALRQITIYLVPMTSKGTRTEASRILANATRSLPEDITMAERRGRWSFRIFIDCVWLAQKVGRGHGGVVVYRTLPTVVPVSQVFTPVDVAWAFQRGPTREPENHCTVPRKGIRSVWVRKIGAGWGHLDKGVAWEREGRQKSLGRE
ncbi:hypothetical protein B0H13DRAFT_1865652 [Mycena leptocephala]|nr:hypothetical protein B0H13DRAFT_1865652 [Mycena leptocephala]